MSQVSQRMAAFPVGPLGVDVPILPSEASHEDVEGHFSQAQFPLRLGLAQQVHITCP